MPDRTEQRRLAAILAADIVGYSRMMAEDEEAMLGRLRSLRAELVDPAIRQYRGRIVKLMGDGSLVEFGSVVDAIRCAIDIQSGTATRDPDLPDEDRVRLRIGINLGDVIVDGDDIYGDGVNIASRLESLAEPEGIVVSGTAFDYAKGKVKAGFTDLGLQQVKNIPEPVRAYSVQSGSAIGHVGRRVGKGRTRGMTAVAAGAVAALLVIVVAGLWFARDAPTLPSQPSIAVLPFDNVGGGEDIDRLADGLTEDIIADLSRFREFDVIARNSTEVYGENAVDIRKVGRELNVKYVLEGSIQREGERIRVTAQLLDARDGTHRWSERWDRPAHDFFTVQTEIAETVAARMGGLNGILINSETAANQRARPSDLSAYDLFLMSRNISATRPPDSIRESISLLEQAVDKDPQLARAWTALAKLYDWLGGFEGYGDSTRLAGLNAAERAIRLDPLDAAGHAALAEILAIGGDTARASAEFDIALRLNPGAIDVLVSAAAWSAHFGQPERGGELADRVRRLDPNTPRARYHRLATAYFFAGRYEDALEMDERQPTELRTRWAWVRRAAIYAALGRNEEADAARAEVLQRYPNLTIQGFVSGPGWGEDRHLVIKWMREAGFPSCPGAEDVARVDNRYALAECVAKG